jgi:hypothetical protein
MTRRAADNDDSAECVYSSRADSGSGFLFAFNEFAIAAFD